LEARPPRPFRRQRFGTQRIRQHAAGIDFRLDVRIQAFRFAATMEKAMPPPTAAPREVVDRAGPYALSERDTAHVLALLENPPEPTPALIAAARRRAART
jgi:hypothetical protein